MRKLLARKESILADIKEYREFLKLETGNGVYAEAARKNLEWIRYGYKKRHTTLQ